MRFAYIFFELQVLAKSTLETALFAFLVVAVFHLLPALFAEMLKHAFFWGRILRGLQIGHITDTHVVFCPTYCFLFHLADTDVLLGQTRKQRLCRLVHAHTVVIFVLRRAQTDLDIGAKPL